MPITEITENITIFNRSHYRGIEISKDINILGLRFCFDLDVGVRPDRESNKLAKLAYFSFGFLFRVAKAGIDSEENLCKSERMNLFGEEGCFTWLNPKMNYFFINVDYGNLNEEIEEPLLEVKVGERNLITL